MKKYFKTAINSLKVVLESKKGGFPLIIAFFFLGIGSLMHAMFQRHIFGVHDIAMGGITLMQALDIVFFVLFAAAFLYAFTYVPSLAMHAAGRRTDPPVPEPKKGLFLLLGETLFNLLWISLIFGAIFFSFKDLILAKANISIPLLNTIPPAGSSDSYPQEEGLGAIAVIWIFTVSMFFAYISPYVIGKGLQSDTPVRSMLKAPFTDARHFFSFCYFKAALKMLLTYILFALAAGVVEQATLFILSFFETRMGSETVFAAGFTGMFLLFLAIHSFFQASFFVMMHALSYLTYKESTEIGEKEAVIE